MLVPFTPPAPMSNPKEIHRSLFNGFKCKPEIFSGYRIQNRAFFLQFRLWGYP